jgi:uncharacterized membrane-anchored protein YjiN (DUF445 family)
MTIEKEPEPLSPFWQARFEEVQRTQNDVYIASRSKNRITDDEARTIAVYDPWADTQSYSRRDMEAREKTLISKIATALGKRGLVLEVDPDGNFSVEEK